ncbi:MAG: hypothetical protein JXQ87_14750 [Bacteroidia bacterium]
MKKQKIIAGIIWLFLLMQTLFVLRYPEPYPSFTLPGFGLSEERFATQNEIAISGDISIERKELAFVDYANDITIIDSSSILKNVSEYHKKYLFKKIEKRNNFRLNKSNYFYLKYNLYRSSFAATSGQINEIKYLLSRDYETKPKALLMIHYLDSHVTQIDTLEVFR